MSGLYCENTIPIFLDKKNEIDEKTSGLALKLIQAAASKGLFE
jgi:hypothetical protein